MFVDPANGDYREAAGSPTIDAGVTDRSAPLDLDGNARTLGAAPDIGAFEFVPAAVAAGDPVDRDRAEGLPRRRRGRRDPQRQEKEGAGRRRP